MTDPTMPMRRSYGPYTCIKVMGSGPNHTVYAAIHQESGRRVALRVMSVMQENSDEILAACEEQLARIAALDTPYLVRLEDYGNDGSTLFSATALMQGGSLEMRYKYFAEQGIHPRPLPSLGEVAELLDRMATTLDDLHAREIVHGQLDPRNIMLDGEGHTFLADVGLTKLTKIIYGLESTNSFFVSNYAAPELWEGARLEPASDRYSLACVIYELLTGRPPYQGDTIYDLMQKHNRDVARPPHLLRPELPEALAMIFWQALAKPTDRRYPSAARFAEEFAKAIAGAEDAPTGFFTLPLR